MEEKNQSSDSDAPKVVDLPEAVKEQIRKIAEASLAAAEGGWGAGELAWSHQTIAEIATGLCSEYDIHYVVGYDDDDNEIYSTEQYVAPD